MPSRIRKDNNGFDLKIIYDNNGGMYLVVCEGSNYVENTDEAFIRGFLGRMLFSGEESLKNVDVLSGGERVRLMLSKMMLEKSNVLLLDEPTNHLDMESITSLNKALTNFKGVVIISTYDRELIDTVCNRILKINDDGTIIDFKSNYSDYLKKYGNNEF